MMQKRGPIRSIYFPPYGLQGQEFSGHVLWHPEYNLISLQIRLEAGLSFLNLYNVHEDSIIFKDEKNEIEISKVIENGYFGFVVSSSILSSPSECATLYFTIKFCSDQEKTEYREFRVTLIRPELVIRRNSMNIEVEMHKGDLLPKIEPKILLANKGSGTALVLIVPSENSPLRFSNYFKGETVTFLETVENSFGTLKEDYPDESSLFDDFILFFKIGKALENDEYQRVDEYKLLMEKLNSSLQKLKRKNPVILNDISQTISDVFSSVFSLSKGYEGWTTALESMMGQGILFLNPMASFELSRNSENVSITLLWFDMLGKPYSPIKLNNLKFILRDSDKTLIPIYELFGTEGD